VPIVTAHLIFEPAQAEKPIAELLDAQDQQGPRSVEAPVGPRRSRVATFCFDILEPTLLAVKFSGAFFQCVR
jgi:hypothetical protein